MFVGNVQLVQGSSEKVEAILKMLEQDGIAVKKNPDLYSRTYSSFGADEARELRSRAAFRAIGKRRVFLIAASTITTEAQNILLKTIEEPADDALFIFIVPSPETLLSTVRSRAQILEVEGEKISDTEAKKFLAANPAVRMELLKPLLEKGDEDRRDIGAIIAFLSSLERTMADVKDERRRYKGLESIYLARKYIGDKGAMVKPLLEQVALLV